MALLTLAGYRYFSTNIGVWKIPVFNSDTNPNSSGFYPNYDLGDLDMSCVALAIRGGQISDIGATVVNLPNGITIKKYGSGSGYVQFGIYKSGAANPATIMNCTWSSNFANSSIGFIKAPNNNLYLCVIAFQNYTSNPPSDFTAGQYPSSNQLGFVVITVRRSGQDTGYISHDVFTTQEAQTFYDETSADVPGVDPYDGAGDSGTGGGDGTFDGSSDPVPIPSLPTVGATDSGFITLFAPTTSQLKALAYYMWINPLFDVETGFKKIFSDPMDCILGLSVVPISIPVSGAQNVTVGNLVTSVSMNVASQQYIEVDCGSISFANRFFGSYLDFEPYTKMALFVPYSGVHAVNADDIMGKTVTLKYHIDILTGSLVAFLLCGNSVLYEFNGACASNIPVNSMNYASTIENAIRIAVNIGTTVATAGAAAPATAAAAGAATARNIATGINLAGSTAEGALSMKPGIDRAGSLGGTTGIMGNQTPYFIITRPRLCKPKKQNFYKGYPSFIQCVIGDLEGKGYTEFDTVLLANLYLTEKEKDELIGILKGGVYL